MALTDKDRRLLQLFAAIVLGDWDAVSALRQAAPPGEPDRAWRETVLQAHVFAGFPRVVEAYSVLGAAGGLGPLEDDEILGESDQHDRGAALFDRIYGSHSERVRRFLHGGHPDFASWIEGHAYGRILSRPGLPPDRRELLAVAALAALGQDRQLASHARGSLRCGAEVEEVLGVLDAISGLIDPARRKRAARVLQRFT